MSESRPSKIVLADYFLGFSTREISGGARPWRLYYETEEDAGQKPPKCDAAFSGDLYVNGEIKDIASTYYPAIGPYDTTDEDVAEFHVLLAKSAGIDGFMCEFTIGQEAKLLALVNAARKYDFKIGVNWINQSHLSENTWRDRAEAIEKARDVVRWLAENVYKPCGVRVNEKYLLLVFLAHPRDPSKPFDPFFSPAEVRDLKQVAHNAGLDANFVVLPWERLPDLPAGTTTADRVWDGYFPWVWSSSGKPTDGSAWSRVTTRAEYIERLRDYYAMAKRVQREGRIGITLGAVCPGFDDHKGQAWGEGLKRYLPRDGGLTLKDTWTELKNSGVDIALIITWNDWVESSQIEPSLELGYQELVACAEQIADWKKSTFENRLLVLPEQLLRARRDLRLLAKAGYSIDELDPINKSLDKVAETIATQSPSAIDLLASAQTRIGSLKNRVQRREIHAFWELGFDSLGLTAAGESGFAIADDLRSEIHKGHLVAKFCFEYLDNGVDFIQVLVDAADEAHQIIASFKKTNTDRWLKASLELLNARFVRGLPGQADFLIRQRNPNPVRMVRIDGAVFIR